VNKEMTKECMCGMATSKIQSALKGIKMDLRLAKEIASESEYVSLEQNNFLIRIDNIEIGSDRAVTNCDIPKYFSDRVKEHTNSMKNTVKKKRHTHRDVMDLENDIIFIEDSLDTHLKGCAKK
jgi:LytS/YehU family sensor histidine kinase